MSFASIPTFESDDGNTKDISFVDAGKSGRQALCFAASNDLKILPTKSEQATQNVKTGTHYILVGSD